MTLLPPKLRCRACDHRFWSSAPSRQLWIACPSCGAHHARPEALDPSALSSLRQNKGETAQLEEWVRASWIGKLTSFRYRDQVGMFQAGVTHDYAVGVVKAWGLAPGVMIGGGPVIYVYVAAAKISGADGSGSGLVDEVAGRYGRATNLGVRIPDFAENVPADLRSAMMQRTMSSWFVHASESGLVARKFDFSYTPMSYGGSTPAPGPSSVDWTKYDGEVARLVEHLGRDLRSMGAVPLVTCRPDPDPSPLVRVEPQAGGSTTRDMSCAGCGASVSLGGLVGGSECPYCAAPMALTEELAHELRAYRESARAQALSFSSSLSVERLWAAASGDEASHVACFRCGAPNPHVVGTLQEACAFCGAALVPEPAVLAAGLTRAGQELSADARTQDAQRQRRQTEHIRSSRRSAWLYVPFAIILPLLAWFGVLFVYMVGTNGVDISGQASEGLCVVAGVMSAFVVVLWIIAFGFSLRAKRGGRVGRAFRNLAEQLGAAQAGKLELLQRWSEAWWHDALAFKRFGVSASHSVITLAVGGYAVALDADLYVSGTHAGVLLEQRAQIFLAAKVPIDAPYWIDQGAAAATTGQLRAAGFDVELHGGGLVVRANPETLKRLKGEPAQLRILAPIAFTATHLATQLGALPAGRA